MRRLLPHFIVPLLAALLAGPLASFAVQRAEPPAGGIAPTLALSPNAIDTVIAVFAVGLAACACAFAAARVSRAGVGLVAAGCVIAWADLNTADLDQFLVAVRSRSALAMLAAEGAVVLALGLAIVLAAYRGAGDPLTTLGPRKAAKPISWSGLITGAITAGAVATLIAANPLKLQCLTAATAAGIVAGVAVRLSMPTWAAGPGVLVLGALAIIAPLIGWALVKDPVAGHTAEHIVPIARLMPADWLVGALIGVPIGRFWTAGTIDAQSTNDQPETHGITTPANT